MFGAGLDPDHPNYDRDLDSISRIERGLDAMDVKGMKRRSWAVEEGKVTDAETGTPIRWVVPRMILETKGEAENSHPRISEAIE
jgi:hypothetical protein